MRFRIKKDLDKTVTCELKGDNYSIEELSGILDMMRTLAGDDETLWASWYKP